MEGQSPSTLAAEGRVRSMCTLVHVQLGPASGMVAEKMFKFWGQIGTKVSKHVASPIVGSRTKISGHPLRQSAQMKEGGRGLLENYTLT